MTTAYFSLASGNFFQDWSNAALITADDNWTGVASIMGYRGDNLTTSTGVNPQTVTAADDPGVVDVIANQTNPNTNASGGVAEFDGIANRTIALQGSGTADAPYLQLYLNATGRENIVLTFNVRDLDGSTDNAVQPVAVQYRIGESGSWTDLPTGFVADGTTGPSLATATTAVSVTLPAGANNQAQLQIRIMTANAAGNDEWVGIDDIGVASDAQGAAPADVSIDDVTMTENDDGTQTFTFTVTRTNDNGDFTVDYTTADDTATAGSDYLLATNTLTFAAGSGILSQTISVTVNGDLDIENTEQFFVNLSNVVSTTGTANIVDGQGIGTITNDDFPPTVSIGDVSVAEGDSGTTELTFTVTRTDENTEFTLDFNTVVGGSATAGDDYVSVAGGTVTFTNGGALTQTVTVTVNGDLTVEGDETVAVEISNIQNTVGSTAISDGAATGTILNDDTLKIYDIQGAGHTSSYNGQQVTTVGVVTAIDKDGNGYWIQDPTGDGNRNTSDGIYVFTSTPVGSEIVVGNLIRVSATVSEFAPGGSANLTLTELVTVTSTTVLATGQTLPTAMIIGDTANGADYTPPTVQLGSTTNAFDPTVDGVDFWESMEGMLVTLQDVRTTTPFKSSFGEVVATMDVGDNASANSRGGLTISDQSPNGTLP
eukprot:gene15038-14837_t